MMSEPMGCLGQILSDLQNGNDLDTKTRQLLIDMLQERDAVDPGQKKHRQESWKLEERIKELQCLYSVMDLLYSNRNELPVVLTRLVELIPPGFVSPENTYVRLELGPHQVTTKNFRETVWSLSATLLTDGRQTGSLTIYTTPPEENSESTPFLDEEGELIEMLAKIIGNFYEQDQISSDLKQKEEFLYMFRLGIEYSDEAIFITDPSGEIIYVNSSFVECYGYSEAEVIGQTPRILKSGQNPGHFYEQMWEKLLAGEIATGEIVNRRKDGRLVIIEYSSNPIVSRDGVLIGFLAIHHDVTERKSMEQKLEESLREKNTLLSEIHHRVKNNLAVVSGMLMLQANEDEKEHEEIAKRLFESVARIKTMANIHEQLYQSDSFSRLEISENFKMLTKDVINTLLTDINIKTEFECPPIYLNINQAIPFSLIFNEVLTNILKHAFTGRKSGRISVELASHEDNVRLVVNDNGIGLPDGFSVDGNKTLGMILIRLLSQQIRGEYSFKSDDKGTRFEMSFKKQDIKGTGSSFIA